jgi:hypothetical protein
MNPQFHIQIPRSPSLSKCHVVVSVTQQYETNTGDTKKRKKRKLHHIGFAVYEVPPHMTRLTPLYVAEHVSTVISKEIKVSLMCCVLQREAMIQMHACNVERAYKDKAVDTAAVGLFNSRLFARSGYFCNVI